jgi:ABC-type uncharacterized transport system permease subunit
MTPDAVLFTVTLFLYLGSSVGYHLHLFGGSDAARKAAGWTAILGVVAHTAAIGVYCSAMRGSVLTGTMPYSLVAYFIALGQVGAHLARWNAVGSLAMPLAFVAQAVAGVGAPGGAGHGAAGGALLRPHVTVLLLSFAAFALAFCLAIIYLVEARLLKQKKLGGVFDRLPPLESAGTAAHWLAIIGFSMLTLGVITGAIAAPSSWGPDWYTNPRLLPGVITSLVAWVIYAAYLGVSTFLGWRGRRTTYFLIAGFVVVLVAFFASVSSRKSTLVSKPVVVIVLRAEHNA